MSKLKRLGSKYGLLILLGLGLLYMVSNWAFNKAAPEYPEISLYSLEEKVAAGVVKEAKLDSSERQIKIALHDGSKFLVNYPAEYDDELTKSLIDKKVAVTATHESFWDKYGTLAPSLGMLLLILFGGTIFSKVKDKWFVRSKRVKDVPDQKLSDVIGADEAIKHLDQLVEYLEDPAKFKQAGVEAPKGWLFEGPSGTGKTLTARALAGQAGVPVYVFSGSDFKAKFYGESEGRVSELFRAAREAAQTSPVIIVIDEIDAVGSTRGSGSHEVTISTLNKLLTELDGFLQSSELNVVIIGTTNRKNALDPALLRRLTKHLYMPEPDVTARELIFRMYSKKLAYLGDDVNFVKLARRTMGMSGADIKSVCNNAGLLAIRQGDETPVAMVHFERAIAEQTVGHERSRVVTDAERRATAVHEGGHALVALLTEDAATPEEVSIIPRGDAGGVTHFSQDERGLYDWPWLNAWLDTAMGGRAAERLLLGDRFTSGAGHDLQKATDVLTKMIAECGMGKFVGWCDVKHLNHHPAAAEIATEVADHLQKAVQRATTLLTKERDLLDKIVERLLEVETISNAELRQLAGLPTELEAALEVAPVKG